MGFKHAGALLALAALCTPAAAFDGAQTIFYVRIPLATHAAPLSFGMRLQGGREQEAIEIDERMLRLLPAGGAGAGWLLAGAVVVGAAVAISGDKRAQHRAEQQAGAAAPPAPCPENCK
jgi:hypothetical protein